VNPANAPLTSQRKQATSGKQRDRHPFNEQQRIAASHRHKRKPQPATAPPEVNSDIDSACAAENVWPHVMLTTSSDSHAGWMDGKRRLLSLAMVATLSRD